jgi:hypothetical protein
MSKSDIFGEEYKKKLSCVKFWKYFILVLCLAGGWRKLHNEKLHGLYASPSIVRVIKARGMIWAGHVARMGELRVHTTFWLGGLKGGDH